MQRKRKDGIRETSFFLLLLFFGIRILSFLLWKISPFALFSKKEEKRKRHFSLLPFCTDSSWKEREIIISRPFRETKRKGKAEDMVLFLTIFRTRLLPSLEDIFFCSSSGRVLPPFLKTGKRKKRREYRNLPSWRKTPSISRREKREKKKAKERNPSVCRERTLLSVFEEREERRTTGESFFALRPLPEASFLLPSKKKKNAEDGRRENTKRRCSSFPSPLLRLVFPAFKGKIEKEGKEKNVITSICGVRQKMLEWERKRKGGGRNEIGIEVEGIHRLSQGIQRPSGGVRILLRISEQFEKEQGRAEGAVPDGEGTGAVRPHLLVHDDDLPREGKEEKRRKKKEGRMISLLFFLRKGRRIFPTDRIWNKARNGERKTGGRHPSFFFFVFSRQKAYILYHR